MMSSSVAVTVSGMGCRRVWWRRYVCGALQGNGDAAHGNLVCVPFTFTGPQLSSKDKDL